MSTDVILATGLTLARNDSVLPFPHAADEATLRRVREQVEDALSGRNIPGEWELFEFDSVPPTQRAYLVERGLMTPAFAEGVGPLRAFGLYQGGRASLELNGSNHVRILGAGLGDVLSEVWSLLDCIDDQIESGITYAFDERFGYLTSRVADSGTGMRAFLTVHAPALMITGRLGPMAAGLAREGLALAPLWSGAGGVFQVFNRKAAGTSEGRITEAVARASRDVAGQERTVRKRLLRENPVSVRDHIGRAVGVAQNAWSVSSAEALTLISSIQVGVGMGLVEGSGHEADATLSLMRHVQPAHLVVEELGPGFAGLDDPRIDEVRARWLRRTFAEARVAQ
ncbi:MAG: hypothetical protein ACYC6T_10480 [Thermoleophilia bacterium]